jgi:hypothetical protein
MKAGIWHQCGDRSQRVALELIQSDCGVGVVLSPRDLAIHNAANYSRQYHNEGADVLIDFQFYTPGFTNNNLDSYPISQHRTHITTLTQATEQELVAVRNSLRDSCDTVGVDGVIAPAMVYEAGRNDIVQLNQKLFQVAKEVGQELDLPVYATVALGTSVTGSENTIKPILSQATSLDGDGWYFAFEFEPERIPSNTEAVKRYCQTSLKLAATGKPVFHAFAGPLGIVSLGAAATAIGIGHSQNLWRLDRGRWAAADGQGGGGAAPPRFFSKSLWGTIVYRDEIAQLSTALANQVYTPTTFSPAQPTVQWDRWNANKHLLKVICEGTSQVIQQATARTRAQEAVRILQAAVSLHGQIAASGITLRDRAASYQQPWVDALQWTLQNCSKDYTYLEFIA